MTSSRTFATVRSAQRRRFLKAAAAAGWVACVERNAALAQTASDYKALVCVYLQGGNDGENTLIRYDGAGYQEYAAVRTPASGLNIAQSELLPIQPIGSLTPFGFHPSCGPLKSLFDQKKLAVVPNMGVLVQPTTRAGLAAGVSRPPVNLFSHSDQEGAIQNADAAGASRSGWGGRVADLLDPVNVGTLFPPLTSIGGLHQFAAGSTSIPLVVPENVNLALSSSGDGQGSFDALREGARREILAQTRANVYDVVAQLLSEEGLSAASVVRPLVQNPNSAVAPYFAKLNSSVSRQLKAAATLIEGRAQTKLKRQVFYAHQWGYDTHGNQLGYHRTLLGDLSLAVSAFMDSMTALGLAGSVTIFTLSDFGRTFKPAANSGTDHGWGNHAFVVGGAVKGGAFYGKVATTALNGPDDFGTEGRWIPTTSIEQYGATLCRWFGIAEGDLPYIFPNIGAFPNTNLGFMA